MARQNPVSPSDFEHGIRHLTLSQLMYDAFHVLHIDSVTFATALARHVQVKTRDDPSCQVMPHTVMFTKYNNIPWRVISRCVLTCQTGGLQHARMSVRS